jgi:hypothetical protein
LKLRKREKSDEKHFRIQVHLKSCDEKCLNDHMEGKRKKSKAIPVTGREGP